MQNSDIIAVTGGLGSIGKHFVARCLADGRFVKNFDAVSYAADHTTMQEFEQHPNYRFTRADIRTLDFLPECDVIVNFAAESHVDNSITSAHDFCTTNVLGVQNLLELTRRKQETERPLFVEISTDEVYGDITSGTHTEDDRLVRTKAAAEIPAQTSWLTVLRVPSSISPICWLRSCPRKTKPSTSACPLGGPLSTANAGPSRTARPSSSGRYRTRSALIIFSRSVCRAATATRQSPHSMRQTFQ